MYVIGCMSADIPIINNMLNMFDPSMFPIAISLFPFIAAVTLVTSSDRKSVV